MSKVEIFIIDPITLTTLSFYPRNYNPDFLFVKRGMAKCPYLSNYINREINGGSTPPAYLFRDDGKGIPFVKTSAVTRHYINVNDLQSINPDFHRRQLKRSITKPYDVIYTMTGKFMGKAALCPSTITEINMSQNSVVLHTESAEKAAFLTIYLNSEINRIQVRGTYSITKQKFMNQTKIASLKVMPYESKYNTIMRQYLDNIDCYYSCIEKIKHIIDKFNTKNDLPYTDIAQYGFSVQPKAISKCMLAPNYYRTDVKNSMNTIQAQHHCSTLEPKAVRKGSEVGSANYCDQGIPFIKTSDIVNYDVDYEPDCYCPEVFLKQLNQDIKKGDIIFAKDGKPGEVAIIQEDNNVVISSGLIKYKPQDDANRYWVFLLLSSKYGTAYFKKWFVIASTMLHLRSDFFKDFKIPDLTPEIVTQYVQPLKEAFEEKCKAFNNIKMIKINVEKSFTDKTIKLEI